MLKLYHWANLNLSSKSFKQISPNCYCIQERPANTDTPAMDSLFSEVCHCNCRNDWNISSRLRLSFFWVWEFEWREICLFKDCRHKQLTWSLYFICCNYHIKITFFITFFIQECKFKVSKLFSKKWNNKDIQNNAQKQYVISLWFS